MQHVWAPFVDEAQADAADFLHSLWSFAAGTFEGRFFHRSVKGHLEERDQFPLNLIFPDDPQPADLDALVNAWADEGCGLVLNLQRSTLQQGQWTKHHREIDIPTRVQIPFSEDGINVLHQGEGHENAGHRQRLLAQ